MNSRLPLIATCRLSTQELFIMLIEEQPLINAIFYTMYNVALILYYNLPDWLFLATGQTGATCGSIRLSWHRIAKYLFKTEMVTDYHAREKTNIYQMYIRSYV